MFVKKGNVSSQKPLTDKICDCKTVGFNDAETEESMTGRRKRCLERKTRAPEVNVTIAESFQKSMKTEFGGLECSSIEKDRASLSSEG